MLTIIPQLAAPTPQPHAAHTATKTPSPAPSSPGTEHSGGNMLYVAIFAAILLCVLFAALLGAMGVAGASKKK